MKRIAIIGSGWRAQGWARTLQQLSRFGEVSLSGAYCRTAEGAARMREAGAEVFMDEGSLLAQSDAALLCVPKAQNFACAARLSERMPVLCETPAGVNEEEFGAFSRLKGVQVAEQYPFQPRFAALAALAESGELGKIGFVALSCCHGYHAARLFRLFLGAGLSLPEVRSAEIPDLYAETCSRAGEHAPVLKEHRRHIALLVYPEGCGLYDFSGQYFSPIRAPRVLLQGSRGETDGFTVRRVGEHAEEGPLFRRYGGTEGDLGEPELFCIEYGGKRLWENQFRGARLSGEELAMAECVCRFARGETVCPPQEAAADARLGSLLT